MRKTNNQQPTTNKKPDLNLVVSRKLLVVGGRSGFTLIEIMVAVSIFSIVMVMATGALLSILDANRKAQSQQTIFSNLDSTLESMSRTIRVGTTYRCIEGEYSSANIDNTQDCNNGADAFAFEKFGGIKGDSSDQFVYCRFDSVVGNCSSSGKQIARSTDGGANFVPITSPEIIIEGLTFFVRGSTPSNSEQPIVLISLYGCAGVKPSEGCSGPETKTKVNFNLQTAITQRLLDI